MAARVHGAWPALLTPATSDGGVDDAMLRQLTAYLLEKDIDGLYICGSTGEGVSLSVAERCLVAEVVMDEVAGRVPVIVHVGALATRHAVKLARHARDLAVAGVASILPPFGRGIAATYLHYETIAAAAPDVPFYPYLFGGQVDAVMLLLELLKRIPNLGGAKYTGSDMYELQALVELTDAGRERRNAAWAIFSGMDEQCVFAAMFGSPANIGSTLNLMPGVYKQLRASYEAGDVLHARDLQVRANRVTRVLHRFGIFGALFEGLRYLGLDCGEPRLPNASMAAEQRAEFRSALDAVGFLDLAAL
ncbi:MAG: dihydrodipicolinate synthase family protein [Anaerolineae bacterium]|jgi:N-acetylneuraminate lyase|nr:dihydrodipicolinate synthase family protein [Anaerolineae bacterium]